MLLRACIALLAAGATRLALRRAGLVVRSDDDSDSGADDAPDAVAIAPPRPVLHGLPEASSGSPPFESAYDICRGADGEVETLGAGSFGAAVLVRDVRTGALAACKEIPKRSLRGPRDVADVRREIFALRRLRGHPGIVTLLAPFECKTHVRVVTEFLDGGELFDAIVDAGCFSELDAARCFHQIVDALAFCHDAGIAHRDVKPENLMIKNPTEAETRAFRERSSEESESESSPPLRVVAIDFGLCVEKTESDGPCEEVAGTPYYVAPEVLERNYDPFKADVWSAGVVLYVLLTGYPPFASASDAETMALIKSRPAPDFSDVPSAEAAEVLAAAFRREEDRPSAREMLAMPWVRAGAYTPPATREADHERRATTRAAAGEGEGEGEARAPRGSPPLPALRVKTPTSTPPPAAAADSAALSAVPALSAAPLPSAALERLRAFQAAGRFKKMGMLAMAKAMKREDIKELERTFRALDKDGSGTLTVDELREGVAAAARREAEAAAEAGGGGGRARDSSSGASGEDGEKSRSLAALAEALFASADVDGDGALDYAEFIASTMSEAQAALERNLARAFDHFDEDNSGFITIEEARRVLDEFGSKVRAHSSEEARAFLKEADADGDGRIDWEEFVRVMTRTKD
jgi:calcium-dependent protein kinase